MKKNVRILSYARGKNVVDSMSHVLSRHLSRRCLEMQLEMDLVLLL